MDFTMSERQTEWLNRVRAFMDKHVRPAVPIYKQQDAEGVRWKVIPILEDLKKKAKAEGLWNMFMPPNAHEDDEFRGAGLSNLEYAPLSEVMGHISWASEVFNCSAPDTGNMEVFMRYASREQKRKWLRPLMDGEIRSAFLMTEPAVASSDATNIETSIKRDGDHYVINGRKCWFRATPRASRSRRCCRYSASTMHRTATRRCCWRTFGFPPATFCSVRAGALKSRRAVSVPAAFITACAPSARPRRR